MQGTAKDISFPDVVYLVLHSKRATYDTVSHLLAPSPPTMLPALNSRSPEWRGTRSGDMQRLENWQLFGRKVMGFVGQFFQLFLACLYGFALFDDLLAL